jgi:hypothetical protein
MKTIIIGLMLVFGASACQAQKAEPCVQKYITYPKLNESEFDALVDFTFKGTSKGQRINSCAGPMWGRNKSPAC